MKVVANIFMSMLIAGMSAGMSAGVYAQGNDNPDNGANSTLTRNSAAPGTVAGNNAQTNTGLSKGSDGIVSSMRANGTRTTESPNLRAPNRTGTMPRTR
jgi:hypothetical protein